MKNTEPKNKSVITLYITPERRAALERIRDSLPRGKYRRVQTLSGTLRYLIDWAIGAKDKKE
jgi:hypothetical protein